MKDGLNEQGIYSDANIDAFKVARFETVKTFATAEEDHHKAMFASTQQPTDLFNSRLKALRSEAARCEVEFQKAAETGDEASAKKSERGRKKKSQNGLSTASLGHDWTLTYAQRRKRAVRSSVQSVSNRAFLGAIRSKPFASS
jgi:hypothetical protein